MRSHIAVASGAILALTISFQALAQNANQSGMSASSNANSGGAASNSNSSKTPVNMGIVRQGLLGVIPAVAPYQENSPGPHITSPDPASLTMATMGAFSNAIGQAMLPPDAPPWQRAQRLSKTRAPGDGGVVDWLAAARAMTRVRAIMKAQIVD